MRIAVPSDDSKSIAAHFGKTRGFLVFDAQGSDATLEGYRTLDPDGPSCNCEGDHGESHHARIVRTLADCDLVLVQGIGPGMVQALAAAGVEIRRTTATDPLAAIADTRRTPASDDAPVGCGCSHH